MASLRKRNGKWQVQIRRAGSPHVAKSFTKKTDALEWARHMETLADRSALPANMNSLKGVTVGDLLIRYRDEVVSQKRSRDVKTAILNAFLRLKIARTALSEIGPHHFAAYRDGRLGVVKPATVSRELGIIQHAFNIAEREWNYPIQANPLSSIRKPKIGPNRERRVTEEELNLIIEAAEGCRNVLVSKVILLAVETGMRQGEILNARWSDLDLQNRTLHLPKTKNGFPRTIPLSPNAIDVLKSVKRVVDNEDKVFPLSQNAFKMAWRRLIRRSGVANLRFHDLRHEAISRFFERGLSIMEVALISGHREIRMLKRYTHLKAETVAKRLSD